MIVIPLAPSRRTYRKQTGEKCMTIGHTVKGEWRE